MRGRVCCAGWRRGAILQEFAWAGVVQWQYRSFPSFGRGFDSHRPLHNSRCFNCPYTANLAEFGLKMDRFGLQMDPTMFNWTPMICRVNRAVVQWPALHATRPERPRGRSLVFSPHGA